MIPHPNQIIITLAAKLTETEMALAHAQAELAQTRTEIDALQARIDELADTLPKDDPVTG